MKLVRFLAQGSSPGHGIWEDDGIRVVEGSVFGKWEPTKRLVAVDQVKILPPVDPPNIIAIGLNYRAHADEGGAKYPKAPAVFLKATTTVIGHEDAIRLPQPAPSEVDYEGEVALVIGKPARKVSEADALNYLLGYTAADDVSARDAQLTQDIQWARGKSFDTFCPLGPVIQTEGDPDKLQLTTRVNGEVRQNASTTDLIFNCRHLISYLSHQFTLLPGTVILTGTPSGVGWARNPKVYLKPDDVVEVEVENVGILRNHIEKDE